MQSKESLEKFYQKEDPWGYKTNPDDAERKDRILLACERLMGPDGYHTALDIGAGEGWITADLPARNIYAYELSEAAALRLPHNVFLVPDLSALPPMSFDLVTLMGVLYKQYDHSAMLSAALRLCKGILVTCNIESWEINDLPERYIVHEERFPYREFVEHLCVYDLSLSQHR